MGACCSGDPTNRAIGGFIDGEMKKDKRTKKLLFLGSGSSGKSTLFKQLACIHADGFDLSQRGETARTIQTNCINGILMLLKQSQALYEADPSTNRDCLVDLQKEGMDAVIDAIRVVVEFKELPTEDQFTAQDMQLLGDCIARLWELPEVKSVFSKRFNRFSFPDNMDFFFDKVQTVMDFEFEPSDEDMLKARARTSGILERQFEIKNNIFNIYDAGGQRSERKKWIHAFNGVDALLFVAALNHYNAVLFEDESKNAMHESLILFDEIVNSKWFRNTECILFLNKADLFAENLARGDTLHCCFGKETAFDWQGPEFWEGPDYDPTNQEETHFDDCFGAAVQFIEQQYQRLNKSESRVIYVHVTTATDKDNVERVFWDVQNIAVRAGLHEGGVLI